MLSVLIKEQGEIVSRQLPFIAVSHLHHILGRCTDITYRKLLPSIHFTHYRNDKNNINLFKADILMVDLVKTRSRQFS